MRNAGILMVLLLCTVPIKAQERITLDKAVKMSLEHSYNIKAGYHDSLAAAADYRAGRAQSWPTLSLSSSTYYVNSLPSTTIGFKKMEIGAHNNYQTDLKIQLPLYTGGRVANQTKILRENLTAQGMVMESDRQAAAYRTRQAYFGLLLTGALVAAAQASLERLNIIETDVANLYQAGLADSVDILDAALAMQKGHQTMAEKETAHTNAQSTLAVQIGLDRSVVIVPDDSLPWPIPPDERYPREETIKLRRPELQAYDSRIRAAEYQAGLSSSGFLPNLSGFAGYSVGKPNKDMFNKTWNDYFSVGLVLNWELNLGGKVHHTVQSARQAAHSARMAKSALSDALSLQAETALENVRESFRLLAINIKELDIARRQFRLASAKEKEGRLSVNRLLEMESDLSATEQMSRVSLYNYYLAETDYLYAIGSPRIYGGF